MRQRQTDSYGDVILSGTFEKNSTGFKHHLSSHTIEALQQKVLLLELISVTDELKAMDAKIGVLQTGSNYRSGFDSLLELVSESKPKK